MAGVLSAYLAGVVFAVGLGLSGMTQPTRIIGFLDVAGRWDPSLALVMAGAVAVNMILYRWTMRRARPLLAPDFRVPPDGAVDRSLIGGAVLFGIGWGLSGYCPGPALVATMSGRASALAFTGAMIAGMALYRRVHRRGDDAIRLGSQA